MGSGVSTTKAPLKTHEDIEDDNIKKKMIYPFDYDE